MDLLVSNWHRAFVIEVSVYSDDLMDYIPIISTKTSIHPQKYLVHAVYDNDVSYVFQNVPMAPFASIQSSLERFPNLSELSLYQVSSPFIDQFDGTKLPLLAMSFGEMSVTLSLTRDI